MIKIKDFILNENELLGIVYIKEENKLELISKDRFSEFIENATFEDIEWNYENNISESLSYDLAKARIEELEEDLEAEKSTSSNLARRILKAIEYIGSITDVKVRYFNYREFEKQGLNISNEELRKRVKEQKLEGQYIEIDRDDILKILKGEKND